MSKDFKVNFEILQSAAEQLRQQTITDIDELVPLVKKATAAYEKCNNRIKVVQETLMQHFKQMDSSSQDELD